MSRMSDADTDRALPPAAYEEPAAFDPADAHADAGEYPPCVQCGNTTYISHAGIVQCDKCGKHVSAAVPPPAPPPAYTIAALSDFLKVPPDRLVNCLAEFAVFIKTVDGINAGYVAAAKGGRLEMSLRPSVFKWIDDGKRDMTIKFVPTNGEKNENHV